MKQLIFMAALIASLTANAQFYSGIGLGSRISVIKPVASLNFGYHMDNHFLLQGGFNTFIDRSHPAIFNARFGREFLLDERYSLNVTAGSGYQLQSNDHKELNKLVPIGGVELDKYIRDDGDLFFEFTQAGKWSMFTVGIKFYVVTHN